VVTWIVATGTAAVTLILTVGVLVIAGPIFDTFGSGSDNPRWWLIVGATVVLVLSTAADVVAVFVLRGRGWARWALIGLSVVTVLGGVMSAYYLAPLGVAAAAVTVIVLLLMPSAKVWFRPVEAA
jgi:hypothetical protein